MQNNPLKQEVMSKITESLFGLIHEGEEEMELLDTIDSNFSKLRHKIDNDLRSGIDIDFSNINDFSINYLNNAYFLYKHLKNLGVEEKLMIDTVRYVSGLHASNFPFQDPEDLFRKFSKSAVNLILDKPNIDYYYHEHLATLQLQCLLTLLEKNDPSLSNEERIHLNKLKEEVGVIYENASIGKIDDVNDRFTTISDQLEKNKNIILPISLTIQNNDIGHAFYVEVNLEKNLLNVTNTGFGSHGYSTMSIPLPNGVSSFEVARDLAKFNSTITIPERDTQRENIFFDLLLSLNNNNPDESALFSAYQKSLQEGSIKLESNPQKNQLNGTCSMQGITNLLSLEPKTESLFQKHLLPYIQTVKDTLEFKEQEKYTGDTATLLYILQEARQEFIDNNSTLHDTNLPVINATEDTITLIDQKNNKPYTIKFLDENTIIIAETPKTDDGFSANRLNEYKSGKIQDAHQMYHVLKSYDFPSKLLDTFFEPHSQAQTRNTESTSAINLSNMITEPTERINSIDLQNMNAEQIIEALNITDDALRFAIHDEISYRHQIENVANEEAGPSSPTIIVY